MNRRPAADAGRLKMWKKKRRIKEDKGSSSASSEKKMWLKNDEMMKWMKRKKTLKKKTRKKRRIKAPHPPPPHPDHLRNHEAGHTYGGLITIKLKLSRREIPNSYDANAHNSLLFYLGIELFWRFGPVKNFLFARCRNREKWTLFLFGRVILYSMKRPVYVR